MLWAIYDGRSFVVVTVINAINGMRGGGEEGEGCPSKRAAPSTSSS